MIQKTLLKAGAAVIALGSFSMPAHAVEKPGVGQDQSSSGETAQADSDRTPPPARSAEPSVDEIVVTARNRVESLQRVPISVTVVSGERLSETGVSSIQILQSVSAGLSIRRTPLNVANVSLRGLSTGTVIDAFEQSVATFLDGTYSGRGPEFNAALFDLQRVEVVRGAQASLLSKNTSLGAFSVTTRKPGKTFAFDLTATYELELGSTLIQGGMDIPFSDTLQLRLAGSYDDTHGWVRNLATGQDGPHTRMPAGRAVLVWTPSSDIDVTLLYQAFDLKQRGSALEYYNDLTGQIAALAAFAGDTRPLDTSINYIADRSDSRSPFRDNYDNTHGNRAIATVNYRLGDYTLTSVSSYSSFDQDRFYSDNIVGDYVRSVYVQNNRQFQQDLRLTSPVDSGPIDFVVGASFYHEKWYFSTDRASQCPGCAPGQFPAFAVRGAVVEYDDQKTTDWAGFAQLNGHLTDRLTLTGGARLTHEDRSALLSRDVITPGLLTVLLYPGFSPTRLSRSVTYVDGSIGANYKATDDMLIYASASKGTKTGGFLNITADPTTPAGAAKAEYGEETAYTYELGAKLSLPHAGFLNIALFQTDIHHFQQALYQNPSFVTTARNLRSRGAEVELGFQIIDGVRLQGQLAYIDAVRLDTPEHFRALAAPEWSGNANLSVAQPISDSLTFKSDLGAEFRSMIYLTDREATLGYRAGNVIPSSDGYVKFNARIAIESEQGWGAAIVGRNLTNRKTYEYGAPEAFIGQAALLSVTQPRTIALQLSYKY